MALHPLFQVELEFIGEMCFYSVLKSARKKFLESRGLTSPRKVTGIRDQRKIFDLGWI